MVRTITDEIPAGTISVTSSITDEAPDVYAYRTREEYEEWVEAVTADKSMSPSDRADMIAGAVVPDETFEEAMERHADD